MVSLSWWVRPGNLTRRFLQLVAPLQSRLSQCGCREHGPNHPQEATTIANTTPELIKLRLTPNVGREVELLMMSSSSNTNTDSAMGCFPSCFAREARHHPHRVNPQGAALIHGGRLLMSAVQTSWQVRHRCRWPRRPRSPVSCRACGGQAHRSHTPASAHLRCW